MTAVPPLADPRTEPEQHHIALLGKPGCCLCDEAKALLGDLAREHGLTVTDINIQDAPDLDRAYRYRIPVVRFRGVVLDEGRVNGAILRRRLRETLAREVADGA